MKIIYEKEEYGEIVECDEAEATHIHYCYNDEPPAKRKSCRRVAL